MKVLVPDTIPLDLSGIDAELVEYRVREALPPEHHDAEVLVVWQNPEARLAELAAVLHRVELVQTLAAGPDAVLAAGFRPDVVVASGRSLHDATVAEHSLALILALIRRLDLLQSHQQRARWAKEYVAAQQAEQTQHLYTLADASVTIWGFGSIALELAPLLDALGADVTGVARSSGERGGYPVISTDELDARLSVTDVLVSILPATDSTFEAMNSRRFDALKDGALFVNVGRGSTVDENALVDALQVGRLRAAAIDVMQHEPLPSSSTLWRTPNLIITPHVAGNRPRGAAALIAANVKALATGAALRNVIETH